MPAKKPRGERKDRVVQARVNEQLDERLKAEAARRRLPVSQLIRNLLEDTFSLVGNVVDNVDSLAQDAVGLGRQAGDDAARLVRNAQSALPRPTPVETPEPAPEPAPAPSSSIDVTPVAPAPVAAAELEHVYAWQGVVSNSAQSCTRCRDAIQRGTEAFLGLSDEPGPRAWICTTCRETL